MKLLASMICAALLTSVAFAEDKTIGVAVSSNALETAKELALLFEKKHPIRVSISAGSSGKLYAQIRQGAPFQVFLAADDVYTALLETDGLIPAKGRFKYAKGVLAVWINKPILTETPKDLRFLKNPFIKRIAIANPDAAPYGRAAIKALKKSGLFNELEKKLVYGESAAQAFGFAATGNADAAIVPLSIVYDKEWGISGYSKGGEYFAVNENLHSPIIQEAALLKNPTPGAREFFEFLKSKEATEIFRKYGYTKGQ